MSKLLLKITHVVIFFTKLKKYDKRGIGFIHNTQDSKWYIVGLKVVKCV